MKKTHIVLLALTICWIAASTCPVYAASGKPYKHVELDALFRFSLQTPEPTIKMMGGVGMIEIRPLRWIGIDGFYGMDVYSTTYSDGDYSFTDSEYGAGLRIHVLPALYVRGSYGWTRSLFTHQTGTEGIINDKRWSAGIGICYPTNKTLSLHLSADYRRFMDAGVSRISGLAGIALGF